MATNSVQIHFTAPSRMKKSFDNVLKHSGVDINDAYRIFMQQTINHNGLPFRITANTKNHYTIINHPKLSKRDIEALYEDKHNQGDYFNVNKELRKLLH